MDTNNQTDSNRWQQRKKRVARIKKYIVLLVILFILIPNVVSIYSLIKINSLNSRLDTIGNRLEEVSKEVENVVEVPDIEEVLSEPLQVEGKVTDTEMLYQIPDNELYPDQTVCYLTFDDGPSKYTEEILDILNEYQIKATFFVVAKEGFEAQYKRMTNEGHTLGLHSFSHKYSDIYKDENAFETDVNSLQDFLLRITGENHYFYRFPGGSSNSIVDDKSEMFEFLEKEGYTYFDWNVTSKDASTHTLSATEIVSNVTKGVEGKKNAVILMHDAAEKSTTVEALPVIIEKLKDDVVFLPITESTEPVQHVFKKED